MYKDVHVFMYVQLYIRMFDVQRCTMHARRHQGAVVTDLASGRRCRHLAIAQNAHACSPRPTGVPICACVRAAARVRVHTSSSSLYVIAKDHRI